MRRGARGWTVRSFTVLASVGAGLACGSSSGGLPASGEAISCGPEMYISDGGCVRFPGFSDAVMPGGDGESTDDAGDAGSPSDATTAEAGDASEAESSSSVVVCASANDCYLKGPGTVYCCLDKVCAFSNDNTSIVDCTDAKPQLIEASNYDQSCKTDTDCVPISEGNACDLLPAVRMRRSVKVPSLSTSRILRRRAWPPALSPQPMDAVVERTTFAV